jgi:hypothetical protein
MVSSASGRERSLCARRSNFFSQALPAFQGDNMKLGSTRSFGGAIGTVAILWLIGVASASSQGQPEAKPQMVEDVFKNVQVMKGIPVNEFMTAMGIWSAATSLNCVDCHTMSSLAGWANFAEDTPRKRTARRMFTMMTELNKVNFGGRRMVTCYTCHRGTITPDVTPSLAIQYGAPIEDPNEIQVTQQEPGGPTPDQVFDKYIQALGGAPKLAALTSIVAKATYEGFDTAFSKIPTDIVAQAPGRLTTVIHEDIGAETRTFDGRNAWIAAPNRPVPLLALTPGQELEGATLEAQLMFPGQIKQMLTGWRVGQAAQIDEKDVVVVQGTAPSKSPVKLFFDKESGLLVRLVRYEDTPTGIATIQVDYADYRDAGGVKIPFQRTDTWVDGRSVIKLTTVQVNVPVAAEKFARPAPAVAIK